jgi:hypothetical protein
MESKPPFFKLQYSKKHGLYYYVLPKNTALYRGDSAIIQDVMVLEDQQTFFGFSHENVEANYGITFEFRTNKRLKLIALDKNQDTPFYNSLDEEYKEILNLNYGYTHPRGERESVGVKDRKISSYICSNYSDDYDGYACNTMTTAAGGTFHSEAMLCEPATNLLFIQRVTEDEKMNALNQEYKIRKAAPPKKRRPSNEDEDENIRKLKFQPSSLFDDYDEDDEDDNKQNKLAQRLDLFGGKRIKRKTHRPKKQRRRSKKTRRISK